MPQLHRAGANGNVNSGVTSTGEMSPIVMNTYQQTKNIAQGMIDVALLSTTLTQLRFVLDSCASHPYFYFNVMTISLSIFLQVLVGIGLILNFQCKNPCKAIMLNDLILIGALLITIINVFIATFSPHGVQ